MGATVSVANLPSFTTEDIAAYLSNRSMGFDATSAFLREKQTITGERIAAALQEIEGYGGSNVREEVVEKLLEECGITSPSEPQAQLLRDIIGDILNSQCLHPYLERWGEEYHCVDCMQVIADEQRLQVEERKLREIVADCSSADYGEQSVQRGVSIGWLVAFTEENNCWELKTCEVRRKFVLPATAASRCRYVELPKMTEATMESCADSISDTNSSARKKAGGAKTVATTRAKVVGQAATFVSHCWGARWGDLVAAVADGGADRNRRVWIDIFAVRQWPSAHPDLDFASTIRNCSSFLLVCSASPEVAALDQQDVISRNASSLPLHVRKQIAFLRVWCLVEISAAVQKSGMAMVMKCGRMVTEDASVGRHKCFCFKADTNVLYKLLFLIDISKAEATVPADKEMILTQVEQQIGVEVLNRRVRGTIAGSMSCAHHPSVQCAACGDAVAVHELMHDVQNSFVSAAGGGYVNLMRKLLKNGANVRKTGSNDQTALMNASKGGHIDAMKLLFHEKCEVNTADKNGLAALMFACIGGHIDAVKLLLHHHADVQLTNNNGMTPLMFASMGGHIDVMESLLERGSLINTANSDGLTALIAASTGGHKDAVKFLLERGANRS